MSRTADKVLEDSVRIPSLPGIVARLNAILEDPCSTARDLGRLIAEDPPIASRVLRVVNSACYGLRERVLSLDHACAVLGTRVLRNTVLQAAMVEELGGIAAGGELELEALWRHSILCAHVARSAAQRSPLEPGLAPDELYTCGLLHDLGKVAMLTSLREEYLMALRFARVGGRPLHAVEQELLGFTHADVGARIAHRWGLPDGAVRAIRGHHGPRAERASDPAVGLVGLANELCEALDEDALEALLEEDPGGPLGLAGASLRELADEARTLGETLVL